METQLHQLALIRAGHSYRTKLVNDMSATTRVLQMKDIDGYRGINWNQVVRQNPVVERVEFLSAGDILIVARGGGNSVYYIESTPPYPTMAAPHFFHVTLLNTARSNLLPEFLAWQLNQQVTQDYFRRNAEGSTSKSIRRVVVDNTPIVIPPMQEQKAIVALYNSFKKEKMLAEQLIANGETIMQKIANDLYAVKSERPQAKDKK